MTEDNIRNAPADNTYCQIHYWMRRKLGLKGAELIIYGLIHGFSQDGVSVCYAPLQYMMDMTGLSKQAVITLLKKLLEKKLIVKQTVKQYVYQTRNGPRIVKASGCQFFCVYYTVESRKENNHEGNSDQPNQEEESEKVQPVNESKEEDITESRNLTREKGENTSGVKKLDSAESRNLTRRSQETLPNNNLTKFKITSTSSTSAEQHTDTHKKEAEEAENGIIKKIQEVFGENVFDSSLYTHIKTITESQEQAEEYISWLYEYCVKQKPDSLIGLFYTLAQKPYMFNRFLSDRQVPEKQTKQKLEYHCPVCGESYTAKEDYCSHCQFDLAFTDNKAEIAIHQKMFYYLPAGQREQFLEDKRQLTLEILRSGNYSTAQDKIEALLEKYGITESQEAKCQ